MKISHEGLAYKLAWRWRPWCKAMPISRISICELVRAIGFTVLIMWPFTAVAVPSMLIFLAGIIVAGSVISIMFGYRITFRKDADGPFVSVRLIERYKPIYLLAAIWICKSLYVVCDWHWSLPYSRSNETVPLTDLETIEFLTVVFAGIFLLSFIIVFVIRPLLFKLSPGFKELALVAKEYLKAKKQKVCPIVEIE